MCEESLMRSFPTFICSDGVGFAEFPAFLLSRSTHLLKTAVSSQNSKKVLRLWFGIL